MNKTETKQLFLIINSCYQNFQMDDAKISIWSDLFKEVPFKQAQANLRRHILTNRFVPTPADIINGDPERTALQLQEKAEESIRQEEAFREWVRQGHDPNTERFNFEP